MAEKDILEKEIIHRGTLTKRMLQGGAIALVLISIFLYSAGEGKPEWGRFWMIRPLIIVPVSGAMGGVFYYFMDHLRSKGGWKTVLAYIISFVGYIIALWMGTVLGLNGTLWN